MKAAAITGIRKYKYRGEVETQVDRHKGKEDYRGRQVQYLVQQCCTTKILPHTATNLKICTALSPTGCRNLQYTEESMILGAQVANLRTN